MRVTTLTVINAAPASTLPVPSKFRSDGNNCAFVG